MSSEDKTNPDHYKVGGIQNIDYLKAKSTPEEFRGFLRLNAMKYLARFGHKNDKLEEAEKAAWYIERLIKELQT